MITSYICLLLLATPWVTQQQCTTKTTDLTLYPSVDEIQRWNLREVFFTGDDLKYTLEQTGTSFTIIEPVSNTGASKTFAKAASKVRAAKPFVRSVRGVWLNSFVFLNEEADKYTLSFSEGTSNNMVDSPDFTKSVEVAATRADGLECYDVEYANEGIFIVDCKKNFDVKGTPTPMNLYYVVPKTGTATIVIGDVAAEYTTVSNRLLYAYTQPANVGKEQRYLFRVTPAYATSPNKLAIDSLVEVFRIDSTGTPRATNHVLDAATLAFKLGKDSDFQFVVVDFKILSNGDLWILDAQNGIYVVRYLPNGEWKVIRQIAASMGQAFAFDRNTRIERDGSLVENIAVLGYDFFVLYQNNDAGTIYELPYQSLTYPANIHLTQEFVIVRHEAKAYMYDTYSVQLVTTLEVPDTDVSLINPYEPDMIVLTKTTASRYTLSTGQLQLHPGATVTEALATLKVKATAGGKTCEANIKFQILAADDFKIYKLSENAKPFPTTLTEEFQPLQLRSLASGQNMQYANKPEALGSSADVLITSKWELNLKNVAWPVTGDVAYGDILSTEVDSHFYVLLQTKDKKVTIWFCLHSDIYTKEATCVKESQFTPLVIFTKQNFQMWIDSQSHIITAHASTTTSLLVHRIIDTKWEQITEVKLQTPNEFVSFTFLKDYVFVIGTNGQVNAYDAHTGTLVGVADQFTFKDFGFNGTWAPKRLFGNRKLKSNLIFIINGDNVIVADFHGTFTFLKSMTYTKDAELQLAVGQNTFFVVEKAAEDKVGKISEYNYMQVNNIYKTKDINLLWYELQTPLQTDFCSDTGFLFVRALCTKCDKSFILAYRPDTLLHDQLFQAWPLSENIVDGKSIQLSSQGKEQMYIYVNDGTKQYTMALFNNPIMTIKPSVDQPTYVSTLKLNLEISNYSFEGGNSVSYPQTVKVINTQTKITVDDKHFSAAKNGEISVPKGDDTVEVPLGNDWYSGQVTRFEVECEECADKITITNRVNQLKQRLFGDYIVKDAQPYHTQKDITLIQATNAILAVNPDNTLFAPVINMDFPTQTYTCEQIQASEDGLYILSVCQDQGEYSIYVTSCISESECFPLGVKLRIGRIAKFRLIGDILFVLETDIADPVNYAGTIKILKLVVGLEDWTAEELATIDKQSFAAQLATVFNPLDFEIVTQRAEETAGVTTKYFKLLITDATTGLYFYDFTLDSLNAFKPLAVDALNLMTYLNSEEADQYAFANTIYQQFKVIGDTTFNPVAGTFEVTVLVTTSNVAHYGITLTFKQDDQKQSTLLNQEKIAFVINRYGTWQTVNKVAANKNWIAIPYYFDGKVLIGAYELPKANSLAAGGEPITMISGVPFASTRVPNSNEFAVYLPPLGTAIELYISEIEGTLTSYELISEPLLVVQESAKRKDQPIVIKVINDFGNSKIDAKIKMQDGPIPPPPPTPPGPEEDASKAWWIILIVVGVLLVVGVVGFFIYKQNKNKTEQQPLMG